MEEPRTAKRRVNQFRTAAQRRLPEIGPIEVTVSQVRSIELRVGEGGVRKLCLDKGYPLVVALGEIQFAEVDSLKMQDEGGVLEGARTESEEPEFPPFSAVQWRSLTKYIRYRSVGGVVKRLGRERKRNDPDFRPGRRSNDAIAGAVHPQHTLRTATSQYRLNSFHG